MTLRFLRIILLTGLMISSALNAMQRDNPDVAKIQCDIQKNSDRLSFITFSTAFVKHRSVRRNISNTVALQCTVTQSPTVMVNASAELMTIQCAFKDIEAQQLINISEEIPLVSQTVIRTFPNGWQMIITTTVPDGNDPDR